MKASTRSNPIVLLFLLVLSAALFGCSAAGSSAAGNAPAGQGYLDTISVTGFGEAVGAPDTGTVQLGFSTSNTV